MTITHHPFRQKIRTIEEIAEMTGKKPWQIEALIRTGNTIPLSNNILAEDRKSSDANRRKSSGQFLRTAGRPPAEIWVDGLQYPSKAAVAARFGVSERSVQRRRDAAIAAGIKLTGEALTETKKPRGRNVK